MQVSTSDSLNATDAVFGTNRSSLSPQAPKNGAKAAWVLGGSSRKSMAAEVAGGKAQAGASKRTPQSCARASATANTTNKRKPTRITMHRVVSGRRDRCDGASRYSAQPRRCRERERDESSPQNEEVGKESSSWHNERSHRLTEMSSERSLSFSTGNEQVLHRWRRVRTLRRT